MTEEEQATTIDVSGEGLYQHVIGDGKCAKGWCDGGSNWPRSCSCGGLIHADFGDEDSDCNYWLHTKCDRCGLGKQGVADYPERWDR